jgi:hypothetical protein
LLFSHSYWSSSRTNLASRKGTFCTFSHKNAKSENKGWWS